MASVLGRRFFLRLLRTPELLCCISCRRQIKEIEVRFPPDSILLLVCTYAEGLGAQAHGQALGIVAGGAPAHVPWQPLVLQGAARQACELRPVSLTVSP